MTKGRGFYEETLYKIKRYVDHRLNYMCICKDL